MDDTSASAETDPGGASGPEPSLAARQSRAGVEPAGELTDAPGHPAAPPTDRVDAAAATIGSDDDAAADPADDTATAAGTADDDPLTRP